MNTPHLTKEEIKEVYVKKTFAENITRHAKIGRARFP